MFESFKTQPPPRMTSADIAAHLGKLREQESALQSTYDDALANAGGLADRAVESAHAALLKCRGDISRASDTAAAIERRQASNRKAHAAQTIDAAWANVEALAQRRIASAQRVAAALKTAGGAYAEFAEVSQQMQHAMPAGFPMHSRSSFGMESNYAADLIRVEYARNGLPGGPALEGKTPTPLEQRCRENVARLGEARALSQQAAA